MVFEDRFKNHILPQQVHILNVAFLVPSLRREFGGCAGNIAYNLRLLGVGGYPVATVGHDFGPYESWFKICDIPLDYVKTIEDSYTAQAFITTDLDDNQITAFHPGAMNLSHLNRMDAKSGIKMGVISPDGRQGMLEHAKWFADNNIPFLFDPGQGLPMFSGDELLSFIDKATWMALNDYESKLLQEKTGKSLGELSQGLKAAVVTRGGDGSTIYVEGREINIPCAPPRLVKDPTGCGDAYRAGLIRGILEGLDWEKTGMLASLMGAIKVEHHGTQNHNLEDGLLEARFKEAFGFDLSSK